MGKKHQKELIYKYLYFPILPFDAKNNLKKTLPLFIKIQHSIF